MKTIPILGFHNAEVSKALLTFALDRRERQLDVAGGLPQPEDPDMQDWVKDGYTTWINGLFEQLFLEVNRKLDGFGTDSFGNNTGPILETHVQLNWNLPVVAWTYGVQTDDPTFCLNPRYLRTKIPDTYVAEDWALEIGFDSMAELIEHVSKNPILCNKESISLVAKVWRTNHAEPFTLHDLNMTHVSWGNRRPHHSNMIERNFMFDKDRFVPGIARTTTAAELRAMLAHSDNPAVLYRRDAILQAFHADNAEPEQVRIEGAMTVRVAEEHDKTDDELQDPPELRGKITTALSYQKWVNELEPVELP